MAQALQKQALQKETQAIATHKEMADAIRVLSMDAVQAANSGHPGMPMGMADVATVLFSRFLKFDAGAPDWPDRDRFVLSAGHGSMLLYSLLHLTGYPGMSMDDLRNFRQLGAPTAGHPEYGHAPGIETTTGPLGQGIANAVGMALAERILNARHGDDIVDHYTYALAGDGCLMEGLSHEAISLAGHMKLGKLIVLFDDNNITIDGEAGLSVSDDQVKRFEACGWNAVRVDGHNPEEIAAAIETARKSDKPSLIACKTIIGYGAPNKQGTSATHGAALGEEEVAATREALGWTSPPFEVPDHIVSAWREVGAAGAGDRAMWEKNADKLDAKTRRRLGNPLDGEARQALAAAVNEIKQEFVNDAPKLASRQSSQKVLEKIIPAVESLVGGSADLTGSNGTITKHSTTVSPDNYGGNYIYYGVREHGMAATMNGMALHGGIVPYSGTFLVFTDYCRPAIRLSALMEQRVVYVMTHDSIGLGEDGPTHQPVEHLAALRAMPNLNVYRPADSVEVAECWELALGTDQTPSIMVLTRQGMPALRTTHDSDNRCANGAYVLVEPGGGRDVTILATGSEVSLTVEAANVLADDGIKAAVVSMPCWELFAAQDAAYQASVLGDVPRIGIEAAVEFGWTNWLGPNGTFIGMSSFGASAPAGELYKHFGITSDAVVTAAKKAVT
ncbi:MAG: transketolase [Hyphomicrobiaceae bacterium]